MDLARLRQTLATPALDWLVGRLRARMQRGESLEGSIALTGSSPEQRDALDRLLRRKPTRTTSLVVDLGELAHILSQAEICDSLAEAVVALTGPVANRAEVNARRERQWRQACDGVASRLAERPELLPWLADLQATGLLVRLCGQDPEYAGELLRQAADVAARFPLRGVALAELAAQVAGDSHALDPGRPLGTLVLRAAALLAGVERTGDAQSRRDAWAGVGVMCDELSGPVLTLNVPGDSESFTGRALRLHAEHGEPYRLSVRQLLRRPPRFDPHVAGRTVFLCENVNVLAAAANRLGERSAPLICIDGQPKTASRLLLNLLARAGARLVYHGDFDWPGLTIANLMSRRHNAAPWRMSVESYLAAADGALLKGRPVAAWWDARLEPAMIDRGRSVHEEQVLDVLLADLADIRGD